MQTLRMNNSGILRTKNGKFSGYYFYLNANLKGDFQIRISVPLIAFFSCYKLLAIMEVAISLQNYFQKRLKIRSS